jgi:hypothetical protein
MKPTHAAFRLRVLLHKACQGVNPNLGRSGNKLAVKALMQVGWALSFGGFCFRDPAQLQVAVGHPLVCIDWQQL